jgi:hypothetical protein
MPHFNRNTGGLTAAEPTLTGESTVKSMDKKIKSVKPRAKDERFTFFIFCLFIKSLFSIDNYWRGIRWGNVPQPRRMLNKKRT